MSLRKSVPARLSGKRIAAAKRNNRPRRAKPTMPSSWAVRAVVVVLACVGGLAMLLAARGHDAPSVTETVVAAPAPVEADTTPSRAPAAAKSATPRVASKVHETPKPEEGVVSGAITIEGCLDDGGGAYLLKDASGDNVPKSRSWKSGFMKKRTAPIEIVGAPAGVKLASHVGMRVSVTGVLIDREMRAQSLRRVAPTCRQ